MVFQDFLWQKQAAERLNHSGLGRGGRSLPAQQPNKYCSLICCMSFLVSLCYFQPMFTYVRAMFNLQLTFLYQAFVCPAATAVKQDEVSVARQCGIFCGGS